jgi:drug/metabolite transporter (DMT)-like permease
VAVLLALFSAVSYGLSDFLGGLLSRRASAWQVAVAAQVSSTVCVAALALLVVGGDPRAADLGWAAVAGVGSGAGAAFLYRGFSRGRMGVVAPVSAVGAALVPVVVGAATGERPSLVVWLGIMAALPGIWLVSSEPTDPLADAPRRTSVADGLTDGVLAGLGFGLLFAALGQVPERAGWWPLTVAQAAGIPTVVLLATALRQDWLPRAPAARWALLMGPLSAAATGFFLLATQQGYLTVSGVLASLYPASTVLLAAVVLHEKVHRTQGVGLALCALAIAFVAGG